MLQNKSAQMRRVVSLRPDEWVTLEWFLIGVHPYQSTLDFAFFIIKCTIVKPKKELSNNSERP